MRALNHKRSSYHCLRKPLIILCYTPHHAQELLATIRGIDDDGITEIISQPCGPRKLTKALERCNTQQSIYAKRPKCVDSERLLSELVPSPEFDAVGIRGNQCPTNGGPLPVSSKPKNRDNGHMIQKPMLDSLEMYAPGAPPGVSQVVDASRAPCDLETSTQSVLIVDDNSINLKLLVTFMKKQNCHYATTVNGLEALESFKANPGKFRIILMGMSISPPRNRYSVLCLLMDRYNDARDGWSYSNARNSSFREIISVKSGYFS